MRLKFVVHDFALDAISEKRKILADVCATFSVESLAVVRTALQTVVCLHIRARFRLPSGAWLHPTIGRRL